MVPIFSVILAAYVLGCFTTGYYLVHYLTGQDIRTTSSGNLGSRNVGRLLGAKGFLLTFLGDAGKGLLAVWLAQQVSSELWVALLALLAATSGHIWPAQLRFRGGKGFATFVGGLLLLQPWVLVIGLCLCAVLYPIIRKTTKTGLLALGCSPLFLVLLSIYRKTPLPMLELFLFMLLVMLVLYAHRSNIRSEFGYYFHTGA